MKQLLLVLTLSLLFLGCSGKVKLIKTKQLVIERPDRLLFGLQSTTYLCKRMKNKKILCKAKAP